MRKFALQLYESMTTDLQLTNEKGLDDEHQIECCHQISSVYWQRLRHALSIYHFSSDEEEIDFFKNIKPLFTSQIEFYNIMFHAQLFKPLFDSVETEKFWLRELLRLERFTENNIDFYNYISNKETGLDAVYFLRRNNNTDPDFPDANMNELERSTSTSHDHLLAELMALEKYTEYVQTQIDQLKNTVTNGNK